MSLEELLELAEGTRPSDGKKAVAVAESVQPDEEPSTEVNEDGALPAQAELFLRTGVLNNLSMVRSALQILGSGEDYEEICEMLAELTSDLAEEWAESGPINMVRKLADQTINSEEADQRAQERYEKARKKHGPAFQIDSDEERVGVTDADAFDDEFNTQIAALEGEDGDEDTNGELDFFADPHDTEDEEI